MELSVVSHEDYIAKIGEDHKFPINKFSELANYLKKKKNCQKLPQTIPMLRRNFKKSSL
jgi:hypothetical protein